MYVTMECIRFGGPLAAAFGGVSTSLGLGHNAALTYQACLPCKVEPRLDAVSLVTLLGAAIPVSTFVRHLYYSTAPT
jgi:hypothetical protein